MADKTVDGGAWTGCAVMFLQSLCPAVNLLALYKDQREGKFIVFKVIKLTLIGKCRLAFYLGQLQRTVRVLGRERETPRWPTRRCPWFVDVPSFKMSSQRRCAKKVLATDDGFSIELPELWQKCELTAQRLL